MDLQPTAKGARVRFSAGTSTVTDGPFTEARELIGGYWMLQVKSKDEAIEWARRCPALDGDMLELRQMFEMSDFGPDIQAKVEQAAAGILERNERNARS